MVKVILCLFDAGSKQLVHRQRAASRRILYCGIRHKKAI